MNLIDYKEAALIIMQNPYTIESKVKYINLLNIFVQDCKAGFNTEYYGNEVKARAEILFNLQEHFI